MSISSLDLELMTGTPIEEAEEQLRRAGEKNVRVLPAGATITLEACEGRITLYRSANGRVAYVHKG